MNKVKTILLGICLPSLFYALWFEPNNLEVTRHSLIFGQSGKKLKIAHISDLHTKGLATLEKKLIDALTLEKPDVILISGDIATPKGTMQGYHDVISKFKAPLGVYFVSGNWEYWTPIANQELLLEKANIKNIENRALNLLDNIWVLGFEDELEGMPDLSMMSQVPEHAVKIAVFHSPSFFHKIGNIHLSLSGHSHGGQVRLPLVGALWVPAGTDRFDMGWFEKGKSKMYVSRGIGTSILPIRFLCSPELAIFTIAY